MQFLNGLRRYVLLVGCSLLLAFSASAGPEDFEKMAGFTCAEAPVFVIEVTKTLKDLHKSYNAEIANNAKKVSIEIQIVVLLSSIELIEDEYHKHCINLLPKSPSLAVPPKILHRH